MNLQGFYTNKGRLLAAKIAGGATALTVTRVVAGSGHTEDIPSATALVSTEQTLTIGSPSISEDTAVLRATLSEALAPRTYTLTELGVYASDPDEGEILFQIYQLDAGAPVTAGGEGVLRFYLRQSIGAQGVTVVCSGAGLAVEDDLVPLQSGLTALDGRVNASVIADKNYSKTALELQAFLDSLPKLLNDHIKIFVTGEVTTPIVISGFHGSGSFNLSMSGATLHGGMKLKNCGVRIDISNCVLDTANLSGTSVIHVSNCKYVLLDEVTLTGGDTNDHWGIACNDGSLVSCDKCNINGFVYVVFCSYSSIINFARGTYSGNDYGAYVYFGGIVMLAEGAPDTLGGASNNKIGGIIVKANGTLL